jgi:hypothetical protein
LTWRRITLNVRLSWYYQYTPIRNKNQYFLVLFQTRFILVLAFPFPADSSEINKKLFFVFVFGIFQQGNICPAALKNQYADSKS